MTRHSVKLQNALFRKRFIAHLVIGILASGTLLAVAVCAFVPSQNNSPEKGYNLIVSTCGFAANAVVAHLLTEFVITRAGRPARRRWLVWAAFLLLFAVIPVSLIPFAAMPDGGWPPNPDLRQYRGVGPGDWAIIDTDLQVKSIRGAYFYTGQVEHLNPEECGGTFDFRVEPDYYQTASNKLRAKSSEFGEYHPADVQLRLQAPREDALYGQTIRLRVIAVVQYPIWHIRDTFELRDETVVREITIRTATRESIDRYCQAIRVVTPIAALMYVSGAVVLIAANVRQRQSPVGEIHDEPVRE